MNARSRQIMLLWSRARQVCKAQKLTATSEREKCGILNISQTYRTPRPVTGIALLLLYPAVQSYFSVIDNIAI
jgi:hypothetical protein